MIKTLGQLESELERHKQKLVNLGKEFNTIDAFRFIDVDGKGIVDVQEIIKFLNVSFGEQLKFYNNDIILFI